MQVPWVGVLRQFQGGMEKGEGPNTKLLKFIFISNLYLKHLFLYWFAQIRHMFGYSTINKKIKNLYSCRVATL